MVSVFPRFPFSGARLARIVHAGIKTAVSAGTVLLVVALWLAPTMHAQQALPIGTTEKGKVGSDNVTEYTFVAKTAGVLVAAVQGDNDLVLAIADSDGQTLPDGTADRDLNGSEGTEMLSILIPEPGAYKVRVRSNGRGGSFQISGAWMSFPAFAHASSDPDRRPSQARQMQIGKPLEDGLNSSDGDDWDWYTTKTTESGTLAIVTRRVGEGQTDLVLEVFIDGDFAQPAHRSDQDLQGNNANESVTVEVKSGQTIHVKVSSPFGSANTKYRLSSSLVP
jgi:hypothetical protein